MKRAVSTSIVMIVMAALCACTTTYFMATGPTTYPPYDGEVQILDVPLEGVDYEVIGLVSVDRPWETEYGYLVRLLQEEAARNGAHAIIMCSDRICLRFGDTDSCLAAPAIRFLPRAEAAAAPPLTPSAPMPSAKEQALVERGRVTLNIQFDTDEAVVKDHYYADLSELADVMMRHPDFRVVIEGHTDSVGDDAYNLNLSYRRADSVRNCLVTVFGIDASRLVTAGHGETRPVADNATPAGRQLNRRVEAAVDPVKAAK